MTDTEYTPSLAEMREFFAVGGEPRPWIAYDEAEMAREKARVEAFDRWLAAHDAEVKTRALEEAAGSLHVGIRGLKCNHACHEADRITLQMRAKAIREGKGR